MQKKIKKTIYKNLPWEFCKVQAKVTELLTPFYNT